MNTYYITYFINGYRQSVRCYIDYTKREAIKRYREEFGLKHKRVNLTISKNFIA